MFEEVRISTFPDGTIYLIQSCKNEEGFYQDIILTEANELLLGDEYLLF